MCPYCEVTGYMELCNCLADKGHPCVFVYRCTSEHRWKPLPEMDRCLLLKEKTGVKELKENECKVRFESNGKLYVEVGDMVYKVDNPFDEVPIGVEIEWVDKKPYVKGYAPKKVKKSKSKSKK
jgi:hypothetical protein